MTLADEIKAEVRRIFATNWQGRDGRVVPAPENLSLDNEAVKFDRATVLYADLSQSTALVDLMQWTFAAEVYRTYLYCAAKIIRDEGGVITAYDGDRVMAVFIGDSQTTPAARCALKINYAVDKIINPALSAQYPSTDYKVAHVIGIDTSEIRVARIGVRGGNDLVWIGRAANHAAKLASLGSGMVTWITEAAFERLNDPLKFGGVNKTLMWDKYTWNAMGNQTIYGSNWTWSI
jgi:class 3 adenylate cyclase